MAIIASSTRAHDEAAMPTHWPGPPPMSTSSTVTGQLQLTLLGRSLSKLPPARHATANNTFRRTFTASSAYHFDMKANFICVDHCLRYYTTSALVASRRASLLLLEQYLLINVITAYFAKITALG
jgi:hypothetical protein